MSTNIQLTGVFIQDAISGGFTVYIEEFPEAIAEGNTMEEAEANVLSALQLALKVCKDETGITAPTGAIVRKFTFAG